MAPQFVSGGPTSLLAIPFPEVPGVEEDSLFFPIDTTLAPHYNLHAATSRTVVVFLTLPIQSKNTLTVRRCCPVCKINYIGMYSLCGTGSDLGYTARLRCQLRISARHTRLPYDLPPTLSELPFHQTVAPYSLAFSWQLRHVHSTPSISFKLLVSMRRAKPNV